MDTNVGIQDSPVVPWLSIAATSYGRVSCRGVRSEGASAWRLSRGACGKRTATLFVVHVAGDVAWDGSAMGCASAGWEGRTCAERSLHIYRKTRVGDVAGETKIVARDCDSREYRASLEFKCGQEHEALC